MNWPMGAWRSMWMFASGPSDLEIDAFDVGGGEGGLRRAPGVEPHEVQPIGFQHAEDPLPRRHVGRRIAGQRKDGAFQRAAEEDRAAVEDELRAADLQLADAEGRPSVQTISRWRFSRELHFDSYRFGENSSQSCGVVA